MAKTSGKTNSFLLEMILMILFFSVSAAVILLLFASSHNIQKQSSSKNEALLYAQTLAEEMKSSGQNLLARTSEQTEERYLDENWQETGKDNAVYTAQITLSSQSTAAGQLFSATVSVFASDSEKNLLCRLPVTVYLPSKGGTET